MYFTHASESAFACHVRRWTHRVAAALASSLILLPTTASAGQDTDSDVVIIGAGVSGLRAAYQLNRMGWSVTIIEATDDHGGRVHDSEHHFPGFADFPVELGAEQVMGNGRWDGKSHFLYEDIEALDPNRMVQDFTYAPDQDQLVHMKGDPDSDTCWVNGLCFQDPDIYDYWDFYTDVANFDESAPDVLMSDYLAAEKGITEGHRAYHLYDNYPAADWATSANHLSMQGIHHSNKMYPYTGGYYILSNESYIETLNQLYFDEITDRIVYNAPVVTVNYEGERPYAVDSNGNRHTGDALLVTVSVGVLQAEMIDFVPNLPAAKVSAYNAIGMGHGIKFILKFDLTGGAFWDQNRMYYITTSGKAQSCWTPGKLRIGATNNIFTCYIMGDPADDLSAMGEAAATVEVLEDIDKLFPGTPAKDSYIDGIFHDVTSNPYIRGPYSYPIIGTFPAGFGIDPNVRSMFDVLGDTVEDKVFFAGEATNDDGATASAMGAMETGDRAAGEINETLVANASLDGCWTVHTQWYLPAYSQDFPLVVSMLSTSVGTLDWNGGNAGGFVVTNGDAVLMTFRSPWTALYYGTWGGTPAMSGAMVNRVSGNIGTWSATSDCVGEP